jgi:hypothetical protein
MPFPFSTSPLLISLFFNIVFFFYMFPLQFLSSYNPYISVLGVCVSCVLPTFTSEVLTYLTNSIFLALS